MNSIKDQLEELSLAPLECDGYARCAAHILTKSGEDYQVLYGTIKLDDKRYFSPTFG